MDNKKLSDNLKILSKNKGFINALIFLLVVLFLWLVLTSFNKVNFSNNNKESNINGAAEVDATLSNESKVSSSYEQAQKEELEEILSKIEGVGKVSGMIRFESGEVKVPAVDSSNQISKTVEDDGNGGTRTTEQESQGDTVVMSSNGSSSDPFITKVYNPAVTGVIITAEGATSSKVKYEIQLAVSKLYDIGLDKVNVYPSKN